MPQAKSNNSISNVVHITPGQTILGSKTFTNPVSISTSSTNPTTLTWANATGTRNEIAHEGNIIEILYKAISNSSNEIVYKLLFELELKKVDDIETKNEYLTLLKLSNYDYKTALAELIKTERDKALIKLILKLDRNKNNG